MPSTTQDSDGSDDPAAIAEAHRDTVPIARKPIPATATRPNTDARDSDERDTGAPRTDAPRTELPRPDRSAENGRLVEQTRESARQRDTVVIAPNGLTARPTVKLAGRPPIRRASRAQLPVAVVLDTIWAALLSYLPVAAVIGLARTLEGAGGLGGAAHAGAAGWLLGHGVPIGTSIGSLGLAPLLLTVLVLWCLGRAGLQVVRAIGARRSGSMRSAVKVAFAIAITYSVLGMVTAWTIDGRGTEVSVGRAAVNFFVIGWLGAFAGSVRGTDTLPALAARVPRQLRDGIRAGVVAALFIVAAGAAVTGLAVAIGGGQAANMISAYRTGVAGQAGITLVSLAYGVNAVIWAAAYLVGPGFAIGSGSVIRITEVTVGPLPTVPLLAGLPNGPIGAVAAALLAIPVLAGLAAGWLLTRRRNPDKTLDPRTGQSAQPPWKVTLGSGLLAGPTTGIVLGLLAWVSGGSLGDGRMAVVGPDPVQVGLIATVVIAVSATIGACAGRAFSPTRKP